MTLFARSTAPGEHRALYEKMKRDFPSGELPPFFAVDRNLCDGVYDAFLLFDADAEVGYAVMTAPAGLPFALLNFFAVSPERRGQGVGTAALEIVARRYPDKDVVLEIEAPEAARDDGEKRLRLSRQAFYERAGFRLVPTAKARIFGVDMLILSNTQGDIPSVRALMHALYLPSFRSKRWLRFINVRDRE